MLIKRILISFALLCLTRTSYGQTNEMNIGDAIPSIEFAVSNYQKQKLNLSELKGKLVILDFWSPLCLLCIKSFPRIDSLQKEFAEDVQFVLVSDSPRDSVERFFKLRKGRINRPSVPFISADTILHQYFPHYGNPYHVWIDKSGIIKHMTDGINANADNIKNFLKNGTAAFKSHKRTEYIGSLFDSTFVPSIEYFSYISHCMSGVKISYDERDGYEQISMNCLSVEELYIKAFNEKNKYDFDKPGRTIVKTSDNYKYVRPKESILKSKWIESNSYNYHLLLPNDRKEDKYKIMKNDLCRLFGLDASITIQNVKCFVLTLNDTLNKLTTKGGTPLNNLYFADIKNARNDSIRSLRNMPYSVFYNKMSNYFETKFSQCLIDDVKLNQNIDIDLKGSVIESGNLELLKDELSIYGLKLTVKYLPFEVLVIKEKGVGKLKKLCRE